MPVVDAHTLKLMKSLLACLRDAVHLHEISVLRLRTDGCRRTVKALGMVHHRRALELARALAPLGAEPRLPVQPSFATRWRSRLGLRGGDLRIMRVLQNRHAALAEAYAAALAAAQPGAVRGVIEAHWADLKRTRAWLVFRTDQLEGRRLGRRRSSGSKTPARAAVAVAMSE